MIKAIDMQDMDGNTVHISMRADASIPHLYRAKFGKDIMRDMVKITNQLENAETEDDATNVILDNYDTLENMAYIFAKHADKAVPEDPEEWLAGLSMLSIIGAAIELINLWGDNMLTQVEPKNSEIPSTEK